MSDCSQSEPFALQVTDHSMEPEFPQGCIVIVEPNSDIENGCYVVSRYHPDPTMPACSSATAKLPEEEVIFRQLVINDGNYFLQSLVPSSETIPISGPESIIGRVIQRSGKKRKDRKFYL